ncbi:hypothetical protein F4827_003274 [Paraburkholderia bannensis]|uniref:Uncharacterized protein n=1 Tax=Paraburkholderia bannensis TaxID=765414 RepID=A0A7W9TYD1_9BURK|nr:MULTISPECIES: hypothetical protein [Paraburkholderia]MBB3258406.1 hypothetical protein [Paraburkholderia sp. WP4_3_2]MBB6103419.1 hypothetical protein [Paraburkholderia bannensis]
MEHQDRFITFWRAVAAYPVAMTAGAMSFFPFLAVSTRQWPTFLLDHGLAGDVFRLAKAGTGVAVISLVFLTPLVLPFYAFGMLIAHKRRTRHWLYFLCLGAVLSTGGWMAISLFQPHGSAHLYSPFPALIRLMMPVGIVSGFACWAFLHLTRTSR